MKKLWKSLQSWGQGLEELIKGCNAKNQSTTEAYIYIEVDFGGFNLKKYKNPYDKHYNPNFSYDKNKKYYYPSVDAPVQYPEEDYQGMEEMDIVYMKKMYPDICRKLQRLIDEECDKMEYEGSYMYDEYPDKEAIEMLTDMLYERLMAEDTMMMEEIETKEKSVDTTQRRYDRWMRNSVKVMLLNEIFRRRGRRNRRRRRGRRIFYPYYGYRPYSYRGGGRYYGDYYYPDFY